MGSREEVHLLAQFPFLRAGPVDGWLLSIEPLCGCVGGGFSSSEKRKCNLLRNL